MKLITAIIRESNLDQVREALIDAEITRITVSRVSGHGQQQGEEYYRGEKVIPNLIPRIRLEIAVNDEFVKITVVRAPHHFQCACDILRASSRR